MKKTVTIIGGGAWGSAIASITSTNKHETRILTRRDELAHILQKGVSPALDNLKITPPQLATTNTEIALQNTHAVILVVPASAIASTLDQIKPHLAHNIPVALAAKGFDPQSDKLMCHLAPNKINNPIVMLSGPSFADEVAMGKPAALVAASSDQNAANNIASIFEASSIRVYTSHDPIGVAVGGAVKNVIAIASGIVTSLNLGQNARAALITRGLAEAVRLAVAMGGQKETLFGLAGLGDMALTCAGTQSRNFAFGVALGKGQKPSNKLAEGRYSCSIIARCAAKENVDMPITAAVDRVVSGKTDISNEIEALMERPVDREWAK